MRAAAAAGLAVLLALGHVAPAAALSCVFLPFQRPGERFGTKELVAHIEVLEVRPDRSLDVRILRVLHGREERPLVTVDAAGALGWNMPRHWGLEAFSPGTQWVIVMLPAQEGQAAWQVHTCRAFLKVDGGSVVGHVSDLTRWEQLTQDQLASRVASPTRTN